MKKPLKILGPRFLLWLVPALFLPVPSRAQDQAGTISLGVLTFESNRLSAAACSSLTKRLVAELKTSGKFALSTLSAPSGASLKSLVEKGKQAGLDAIIQGQLKQAGDDYTIEVKVYDMADRALAATTTSDYQGPFDGLPDIMHDIALQIGKYIIKRMEAKPGAQPCNTILFVSATIESVDVFINNELKGVTPLKLTDLPPGTYEVNLHKFGYRDWSQYIDLVANQQKSVEAKLVSAKGALVITSQPAGGTIYLNDKQVGETPMTIDNLLVGEYQVKVTHPDYATYKTAVTITEGETKKVHVTFTRKGSLFFESDPLDAQVFLNDQLQGRTPLTVQEVENKTYQVKLVKPGYTVWEQSITAIAGEVLALAAVLVPGYGSLRIESYPANAVVKIDGTVRGTTPFVLDRIPFKKYDVVLSCDGYEAYSKQIEIREESVYGLVARLKKTKTGLTVLCNIKGAEVCLDGVYLGNTPLRNASVEMGTYTLSVRSKGYEPAIRSVTVGGQPGQEVVVELYPKTRFRAALRSLVPGWGQYYYGQYEKALVVASTAGASLLGYGLLAWSFNLLENDYQHCLAAYRDATDPQLIAQYRGQAQDYYGKLETRHKYLSALQWTSLGIWCLNVMDVLLNPPSPEDYELNIMKSHKIHLALLPRSLQLVVPLYSQRSGL